MHENLKITAQLLALLYHLSVQCKRKLTKSDQHYFIKKLLKILHSHIKLQTLLDQKTLELLKS